MIQNSDNEIWIFPPKIMYFIELMYFCKSNKSEKKVILVAYGIQLKWYLLNCKFWKYNVLPQDEISIFANDYHFYNESCKET